MHFYVHALQVRALCHVLDLAEEGKAFTAKMAASSMDLSSNDRSCCRGRVTLEELEKELLSQSIYKMQQVTLCWGIWKARELCADKTHMNGAGMA